MTVGDLLKLCDNDICTIDMHFKDVKCQKAFRYYFDDVMGIDPELFSFVAEKEIGKWKMINPSLIEIWEK